MKADPITILKLNNENKVMPVATISTSEAPDMHFPHASHLSMILYDTTGCCSCEVALLRLAKRELSLAMA
jgi:hypothetical protein